MSSVNKACHLDLLSISDYSQSHRVNTPNVTWSENFLTSHMFKCHQWNENIYYCKSKILQISISVVSFVYQNNYYKL